MFFALCPVREYLLNQFLLYSRGRGLCPSKRCALVRRWKFERPAGQVCSADWRALAPARQALRLAQHRFAVH